MDKKDSSGNGKPTELSRGLVGFLLGLAFGAFVALLAKRTPENSP